MSAWGLADRTLTMVKIMLADPGLNSLKPPGSAGNELDLKVIAGKTPGVLNLCAARLWASIKQIKPALCKPALLRLFIDFNNVAILIAPLICHSALHNHHCPLLSPVPLISVKPILLLLSYPILRGSLLVEDEPSMHLAVVLRP